MEKTKKLIVEAIRELRKKKCECNNHKVCTRCVATCRLNAIHNFLSDN